ncbi:hypothetical protein [Pseudomonas sp. LTJR-52]|uniref:hypothetical protein n=1 Tax=Pseudomonas sp. LTJR-52 TaxID=2479392 RepID=UPI0013CE4CC0|nr:hypothetical protein [Pseudomonas sp. LTJR-52]
MLLLKSLALPRAFGSQRAEQCHVHQQRSEIDQVATAMNELTATAQDVDHITATASSAASLPEATTRKGNQTVKRAAEISITAKEVQALGEDEASKCVIQ